MTRPAAPERLGSGQLAGVPSCLQGGIGDKVQIVDPILLMGSHIHAVDEIIAIFDHVQIRDAQDQEVDLATAVNAHVHLYAVPT